MSNFFLFKKCFLSNCFQILSKKTFRFMKKISAVLAILHPISFDKNSDMSFWRESTLMKVSSFEEKEQKTISFYSKSPPFFWKLHSVSPEYHLRFFGINSKLITFSEIEQKTRNYFKNSQKSCQTAFHVSKETMGENWLLQNIRSGYWAKNGRICEIFKIFIFFL